MPPFDDDARGEPDDDDTLGAQPVDPLTSWPAFSARVRERLEAGRTEYGDTSFERPPGELLEEIQQELCDVCGWSFILFERLERLRRRLP